MAVEFFLPKMTDFMESAEIISWLAAEGDMVQEHQPILEVNTDKVAAEVEAPASGILLAIRAGAVPGAQVAVGETLAYIAQPGETVPALPPLAPLPRRAEQMPAATAAAQPAPQPGEIRTTPVVRRMAKEMGIDLAQIRGTGPGGRIREDDLHSFLAGREQPSRPAAGSEPDAGDDVTWHELSSIQRLTGQRMLQSVQTAPQFSVSADVDMTNALARKDIKEQVPPPTAQRPTITALLVKVAALALKAHPRLNSEFAGGRLKLHRRINVAVAIGADQGLVAPVIQDAAGKSLAEITRALAVYRDKARLMRFDPADLAGGTFTLSNLGMYGVDRFTAILNPPQSAILAAGRMRKMVIAMPDDTLAVRPVLTLTLTVDHRSLDGLQAALFLAAIKQTLESADALAAL